MLNIDPDLFRPEAISPETNEMNEKIEAFLKDAPSIMELGPVVVRELRAKGEGLLGKQPESSLATWVKAKALGLEVPLRVFRPEGDLTGVYLHIHGGGHTIGSADSQDQVLEDYARRLSCAVVSVEYRLAPENPWPAPADDCEAAAVWLFENAEKLFGTKRIAIGGESAGGHLSAVTVLRMRDNHQKSFAGANLVYGVFDLSGTPTLRNWGKRNLVLNTPIVYWFAEQLLPKAQFEEADKTDPAYSPLYARLEGLCPALFSVGTLDPIMDDTLFMAQRWVAAGNETELEIYPGGIHAFDQIPGLTIAEEHHAAARAFLEGCFR
jgi:acetyl esterase/lipase